MAKGSLNIIRENLQTYADRGVFRGFSEDKPGQFSFGWFYHRQMELVVDTTKQVLRFKQLLPGVAAKSELYAELKAYLQERHDSTLPEHRRVDRRRAEITCTNRSGYVSLSLKVKNKQYKYGVNKLVNVVHELFVHLRANHPEYLVENFDAPQE